MNILGTGLSGMIGSRIAQLLSPEFVFENLSLETGVDITQKATVDDYVTRSEAPWVFHFAAYTDVDGSEKDRVNGEGGIVWKVNVTSTEYFTEACKRHGKRLVYISTDYVFDGIKDSYNEKDIPNPQGWYAITKYEGEKRVQALGEKALIIRIANPYLSHPAPKLDFVHKIIAKLASGVHIAAPSDQIFVPTYVDDIANALRELIHSNSYGIFHVVGNDALSPYQAASQIAQTYGFSRDLITRTKFKDFFVGKALRPLRANLKNDKISKLGIQMSTFSEGIEKVFLQEFQKI